MSIKKVNKQRKLYVGKEEQTMYVIQKQRERQQREKALTEYEIIRSSARPSW